jgi:hypothetical protein
MQGKSVQEGHHGKEFMNQGLSIHTHTPTTALNIMAMTMTSIRAGHAGRQFRQEYFDSRETCAGMQAADA